MTSSRTSKASARSSTFVPSSISSTQDSSLLQTLLLRRIQREHLQCHFTTVIRVTARPERGPKRSSRLSETSSQTVLPFQNADGHLLSSLSTTFPFEIHFKVQRYSCRSARVPFLTVFQRTTSRSSSSLKLLGSCFVFPPASEGAFRTQVIEHILPLICPRAVPKFLPVASQILTSLNSVALSSFCQRGSHYSSLLLWHNSHRIDSSTSTSSRQRVRREK